MPNVRKRCAVIACPDDVPRIAAVEFWAYGYDIAIYIERFGGSDECRPQHLLGALPKVDAIVYVLSKLSSSGTLFALLSCQAPFLFPGQPEQWIFRLDDVEIPELMAHLRDLPEGPPGVQRPSPPARRK